MLNALLTFLHSSGYVLLWLAAFAAAVGVPIPMAPVLLAAGAFATSDDINLGALALVVISATIAGNCVSYELGRRWGSRILVTLPHIRIVGHFITAEAVERSRLLFHRHASWTLILTRTILSSLGTVVNLLAGTELYPFARFLFWDALGEAVGIGGKLLLGYIVGQSWRAAGDALGLISLSGVIIVIFAALALIGHRLLVDLTSQRSVHSAPVTQDDSIQASQPAARPNAE